MEIHAAVNATLLGLDFTSFAVFFVPRERGFLVVVEQDTHRNISSTAKQQYFRSRTEEGGEIKDCIGNARLSGRNLSCEAFSAQTSDPRDGHVNFLVLAEANFTHRLSSVSYSRRRPDFPYSYRRKRVEKTNRTPARQMRQIKAFTILPICQDVRDVLCNLSKLWKFVLFLYNFLPIK